VPVNYTASSQAVSSAFSDTGDFSRSDSLGQITYLLEKGVKVSLVYGDRDFACNWIAGERTSLAIEYSGSAAFRGAGYMPIITNSTYIGGQVRQYGNLSFSRVYQAGHEGTSFPELEDPRNDTDRAKFPGISRKLLMSCSGEPCSTRTWLQVCYPYGMTTRPLVRPQLGTSRTKSLSGQSQFVISWHPIPALKSNMLQLLMERR
jgi:hypothetical protein